MKKKHCIWISTSITLMLLAFLIVRWWTISDPNRSVDSINFKEETLQIRKTDPDAPHYSKKTDIGNKKANVLNQHLQSNNLRSITQKTFNSVETSQMDPSYFPQLDPAMLSLQQLENESLRAEIAESLRIESNLSAEQIEEHIRGLFPPLEPEKFDPLAAVDLTPEQLVEEMEMSLLEAGAPQEDIDEIVKGFLMATQIFEEFQAPEVILPNDK